MDEILSNDELREVASKIIDIASTQLTDTSFVLTPFMEPFTLALAIGGARRKGLRWREVTPSKNFRFRTLQLADEYNLLNWETPDLKVLLFKAENVFEQPSRSDLLNAILMADKSVFAGDTIKYENGWAVCVANSGQEKLELDGYTVSELWKEDIDRLPSQTQTGNRKATAASPRIDAVSAAALKPSREKIKKHLEAGGVLLNYETETKSGRELVPGDVVAVRDTGRFRVMEFGDVTKKGRYVIEVEILNGG
jgi:RNA-binding protein YlmH